MRHATTLCAIICSSTAVAQDNGAQLAQELANPIASLYSFPLQTNWDENLGPGGNGKRTTTVFQPIIPFSLDNGANIITRTIFSYIDQEDVVPGTRQSGFGDVQLTAVYSDVMEGGFTWGLGGILKIPTGSAVSGETWALGPAAVGLRVDGPWTYGALVWHQWDIEKNPKTPINTTFAQPFVAYSTPGAWTYTAMTESTYDWNTDEWSIPLNFQVSKLVRFGKLPVNISGGAGYWAASPTNGAEGWRARIQLQAVIPRK